MCETNQHKTAICAEQIIQQNHQHMLCMKTGERKFAKKKTHSTKGPKKMPHCLI